MVHISHLALHSHGHEKILPSLITNSKKFKSLFIYLETLINCPITLHIKSIGDCLSSKSSFHLSVGSVGFFCITTLHNWLKNIAPNESEVKPNHDLACLGLH